MTATIISLLSIVTGLLGAVLTGWLKPKMSFGFTGNIIIGVFSSILFIKSFGRLGFSPSDIVVQQKIDYFLLIINLSISLGSGVLGILFVSKIKHKLPN